MQSEWRPKPGDQVVRRPRASEVRPVRLVLPGPRMRPRNLASPWVPVGIFLFLVLVGGLLLMLPQANTQHGFTPPLTAFFTAASAVTVTGLVVVDTSTYWTRTGQSIILLLIAIGGIGFMTLGSFLLTLIGRRLSLGHQLLLREPLGMVQIGTIIQMVRRIVATFLVIQLVGALLLFARFYYLFPGHPWEAAWHAVFQAISGFNNAGFTVFPGGNSLTALHDDHISLAILGLLIILGGLGYTVIADLLTVRRFVRFSLDTKIVLIVSLALWLLGGVVLLGVEFGRPATLGSMPVAQKVANAFFQSVSARTAGFSTFDFRALQQPATFFLIGLMFIGAGAVSTGGGIRVNTLGVIAAASWAAIRGRPEVTAFKRTIPTEVVNRALAVAAFAMLQVFLTALLLSFTERNSGAKFIDLLFETVSAFGTVGLSTGVTPALSAAGKVVIMATMLAGRLGPLTLALALAGGERARRYHFALERVKIG